MARTPLFGMLQRSLSQAQRSLRTGEPVLEILEKSAERRRVSRRDFLIASATAAAAASCRTAIPPALQIPMATEQPRVVIVGAGIAGLVAGYRLQQAGIPVRLYDAQNRAGGRMLSLRNFFPDSQVAELGGELIDTGHTHIRELAGELSIELDDLATDDPSLERDVWFFDGVKRTEREIVDAFRPIAIRISSDLQALGEEEITYGTKGAAADLDRMSIAQWLDLTEIRGWFRDLLDVGFTTEFGLEIGQQSALNLLTMIDPNPDPFRIYGESDERFHVRGGNDRITQTLANSLGDRIELNSILQQIRKRADGQIECTFARGSAARTVAAEHVIVSIPFTMLRSVAIDVDLPAVKRRAIRDLGYGTNAKLMVGFTERIWRTQYSSNGSTLTDFPCQLTWETSRLQPGVSGILTNFTGGRHGIELGEGTPSERAAELGTQLDVIFPGIAPLRGKEARMHWPTQPFTRGSYACYLPGQWTSIRGAEGEAVGNLHFAGEHCSMDAQGFMEGGCETGERAAQEVLAALRARVARMPRRALLSRVAAA